MAVWVLLGLAARVAWALHLGNDVGHEEADAFVLGWEGRPWASWSRVHPPGAAWLAEALLSGLGASSVVSARVVSAVSSSLGLGCALVLAASFGRGALTWVAALWAVHPALVAGSVLPTDAGILGGVLCLTAMVVWRRSLLGATLVGGAGLLLGGVVLAPVLLCVGLVVRRWRVWLGIVLALALGFAGQRGDGDRPWVPDTAWAFGLLEMVEAPPPHPTLDPLDPDARAFATVSRVGDALRETSIPAIAAGWWRRFAADGVAAAVLRLALFVIVAAGLRPPPAVLAAGVLMVVGLSLAGSGLRAVDLLLVACVPVLGGRVRTALALVAAIGLGALFAVAEEDRPPSVWTDLLADGGPRTSADHATMSGLLMLPQRPRLRLPEAALRHAEAALASDPWDEEVVGMNVRALVENLRFDEAHRVAEDLYEATGRGSPRATVLMRWVEHAEREAKRYALDH